MRFEVEGEADPLLLECDDASRRARFLWRDEPVLVAVRDAAVYGAGGAWGAGRVDVAAYAEWFEPGALGADEAQIERTRERERAAGFDYERDAWERFRARGDQWQYELVEGGSAFGESWRSELVVRLDLRARRGTLARSYTRSE